MAEQYHDDTRYAVAGAALLKGQAVYLDSSDTYKAKPVDGPARLPVGVSLIASADDADARFAARGLVIGLAGGTIAPFALVSINADGEFISAAAGAYAVGRYIPSQSQTTGAFDAAADGNTIPVLLFDNPQRSNVTVSDSEDVAEIAAGETVSFTSTATGAVVGDFAIPARPATLNDGLVLEATVSDDDEVTFWVTNATTGAINPGALTYKALVIPA